MASCGVAKTLHLEQADLVETTGKDVYYVTVVCCPLRECVVELLIVSFMRLCDDPSTTYLQGLLVVLDVVTVDIVVRADRLSELGTDDHAGTFGSGTTSEEHNAATSILERRLEQTHSDTKSDTSASQASLVASYRPGILLELLEDFRELELALLNGQEEPRGRSHGHDRAALLAGLLGHARAHGGVDQTKHLLHLLRIVVLIAAENVGLGALRVADLVDLGLSR